MQSHHPLRRKAVAAALTSTLVLLAACGGGGADASLAAAEQISSTDAGTAGADAAVSASSSDSLLQTERTRRRPAATGQATLGWTATPDPAVVGYRVYYGSASKTYAQTKGSGVPVGTSTAYTATGLANGTQYFFAVTSVDASGHESDYSNEAAKTVQ